MAYKDRAVKTKKQNQYIEKTYDRINLLVTKGKKEIIQSAAQASGESINGFINRLINAEIERMGQGGGNFHISDEADKQL